MIDELKKNVDAEIGMLREIVNYLNALDRAAPAEKKILEESIKSLGHSMKMVNNSIPKILANTSAVKSLPGTEKRTGLEKIRLNGRLGQIAVTLNKEDRERFLKESYLNEKLLRKIKKKDSEEKETYGEFKAVRGYLRYANKFFLKAAKNSINNGYFKPLSRELKKANIDILFEAYVAMIYFTTIISFFGAIILMIFLNFFNLSFSIPFISIYGGSHILRFATLIWIPIVIPIATFLVLYYYPSTERKSTASKIDQELPFAVIYMSAISGSGIEPTEIFKIIGVSREYPHLRREIRKVLNQINIYGYDLITALNNVSKTTSSQKLSELLSGIATTTSSGGSLSEFFEKRSETLLLSYRLERENYTKVAETFMDIYISVVIAAPMILMLLLIVLSVSSPDLGISPGILTAIIVTAISITNIFFLIFLQIKQPSY